MPIVISFLIFLLSVLPASGQTCSAALAEVVTAELRQIQQQHNVAGLAAAVVLGGQRLVVPAGVSAKDSQRPVTGKTIFEVGSVSKLFSSILTGYAQAQGKLSLNSPASRYWPALAGSSFDKITVLELATYTAGGLPLQFPEEVNTDADIAAYFRNWRPQYTPGTMRLYSNPSIALAGHLAARSLGQPFAALMEDVVFPKLGLRDSYIRVPEKRMDDYAWGYNGDGKAVRVNPGALDAEAYGVKTTANDMARFLEIVMEPRQLKDTRLREAIGLTRKGYFTLGAMRQGLGWEIYDWPIPLEGLVNGTSPKVVFEANPVRRIDPPQAAVEMALHNKTGSTNGFGAYVAMVPGKRLGIAILANRNYPAPVRLGAAHRILRHAETCGVTNAGK